MIAIARRRMLAPIALCLVCATIAQAETMTVTTLYSAPINPANAVHPLWTPVQHYHGMTFVVVPDTSLRPMVTQIDGAGTVTTVPLDAGPDYLATADGHNRFTMGIDPDGYLHIIGDMHGYAWWASTYVARYQRQNILYWRSNRPLDVTGGFTFAGGLHHASALPGEEWGGDSRFFNDRNGVLYYSSRVRAFTGSTLSGSEPFIAYGIYRYDHATGLWSALGGTVPPAAAPGATRFNTVMYWEHTGAFEALQCAPRFDAANRLHFAIAGNTAGTEGSGLVYAVSADGGATWAKASGARIPSLPLRGKDGEADQGDLIVRSTKVAQQSPVCIDKDGRVAAHGDGTWRTWNGSAWAPISGGLGILGPDGMLTADGGSVLNRAAGLGQPATAHDTGFGQVFSLSELGLQVSGSIYGVGTPRGTNFVNATRMSVFRASFSPAGDAAINAAPQPPRIHWSQGDDACAWLSWTASERAASYTVKRATAKAGPYAVIAKGVEQVGEFRDASCVNGTAYFYAVSAVNTAGESSDSIPVVITPRRLHPRPPLIRDAVGRNARIVLTWMPLWPAATSYTVKRAAAKQGPYAVIAREVAGLSYTDTGLSNDSTYWYVISAANAASGESADSAPISASPFRWINALRYHSVGYDDAGTATASAENPPHEPAAAAFDGNAGSKWLMPAATGWLQYRFAAGEARAVTRYRMISGGDAPERDPRDWKLDGSMDGTSWTTLDAQTDQAFASRGAVNTYVVANTTAWQCYRLEITRNNGNGLTQLAELELWIDDVVAPPTAPVPSPRR